MNGVSRPRASSSFQRAAGVQVVDRNRGALLFEELSHGQTWSPSLPAKIRFLLQKSGNMRGAIGQVIRDLKLAPLVFIFCAS